MRWELIVGNRQHKETRVRVFQNLQTAYIGWGTTKAQIDTITISFPVGQEIPDKTVSDFKEARSHYSNLPICE